MRKSRFTFYILHFTFYIFLVSCNSSETTKQIPPGILPLEKMVPIITDMHIADAAVKLDRLSFDSSNLKQQTFYGHIYSRNETTKEQFDKSLEYYCNEPQLLDSIYEDVLEELSRKVAEEAK